MRKYNLEKDLEVIKLLKEGLTCYRIAILQNCSHTYVRRLAKENNIIFNSNKSRRLVKNNPFKNLENRDVQYWLGFLAADGYTCKERISLYLQQKDLNHIEKYLKFLASDSLSIRESIHYKKYKMYGISFRNSDVAEYLNTLGYTSNKSFDFNPSFLITWDFLRGEFDGDGYVSKSPRNEISLISASPKFIEKIALFLDKNDIKYSINDFRGNMQTLRISSEFNNILTFIEKLYNNAQTFLERKAVNAAQISNYLVNKRLNSGN